ncbi:MAG: hypothetical protein MZV70_33530 [Desulfobacterales bacterium]|nr:hypothetical protein [Desulfobacterales bacterium]
MKRKLTIAAGIIHEPPILFLDEPTTGIDVESASTCENCFPTCTGPERPFFSPLTTSRRRKGFAGGSRSS